MSRRICIVSESLSDNLGDQAICLALTNILCSRYVVSKASFGSVTSHLSTQGPERKIKFVNRPKALPRLRLHPNIKALIGWYLLGRRKTFENHYTSHIKDSDFVLVGGGQLIKNNSALFCEKIGLIANLCRRKSIPFALIGVGVDEGMRSRNWRTVRWALESSEISIFRDQVSRARAEQSVIFNRVAVTVPDLAFSLPNRHIQTESKRDVGLAINVMNIVALEKSIGNLSQNWLDILIGALSETITNSGYRHNGLALFTTGAAEDLIAANRIGREICAKSGVSLEIFHPKTLDELLEFLSRSSDVIATRMHAGILAYISGCNPVCISWDDKIEGVWAKVGQENRVVRLRDLIRDASPLRLINLFQELRAPSGTELKNLALLVEKEVLENVGSVLERSDQKLEV